MKRWIGSLAVVIGFGITACNSGESDAEGDCDRICSNPCMEEVLPAQSGDDCVAACEDGLGILEDCKPETVAVLECLETIDCGFAGSIECLDESLGFSECVSE